MIFTIHHSRFTLLSPLTFHLETQGKRKNVKAWKNVKRKKLNAIPGEVTDV